MGRAAHRSRPLPAAPTGPIDTDGREVTRHAGRQGARPRAPALVDVRAVTFDVNFTTDADGSTFVLLAVVMSGTNQIGPTDLRGGAATDATTANDLVLRSPHVAARTVQLV